MLLILDVNNPLLNKDFIFFSKVFYSRSELILEGLFYFQSNPQEISYPQVSLPIPSRKRHIELIFTTKSFDSILESVADAGLLHGIFSQISYDGITIQFDTSMFAGSMNS
jgi:hypothetical protein